jgi:glutamate carboxypeptidase
MMMEQIRPYLSNELERMTNLLVQIVNIESQTLDKAGVDRVVMLLSQELQRLGATITQFQQSTYGNHILGVFSAGRGSPITMVLHMDTVHPTGSLAKRPTRIEQGKLYGPGVYDMKASHVIALYAIEALQATGTGLSREVRILCTSDEEVGSLTSRQLIEDTARGSILAMVMEPALPDGRLKSSRKGVGEFHVTARGRASHAGAEHQKGINAIEELAHQVIRLQALTDYSRGVTFSVGDFKGGGVSNVVPDYATITVDTRAMTMEDAEWIIRTIHSLKPVHPGVTLEITGEFNRPPMECNAQRLEIVNRIAAIGKTIGIAVEHGPSGGGSDASFTSAIGVPTMDGFGAVGDGAHAVHEHVILDSLVERSAMCAAILASY